MATILIFIIKRNTYVWEGLDFPALQFVILFASCLIFVLTAILETKSSTN